MSSFLLILLNPFNLVALAFAAKGLAIWGAGESYKLDFSLLPLFKVFGVPTLIFAGVWMLLRLWKRLLHLAFEAFDFLSLAWRWLLGGIRVVGSNNKPLEINADRGEIPIYTVGVLEVKNCEGLLKGRAYYWCPSGKVRIGNEADGATVLNPSFSFNISAVGPFRSCETAKLFHV